MYTLLIVKMCNSLGLLRYGPPGNYASTMHLPDRSDCINLSPPPPLPHLTCIIVWPVVIYHNSGYILCIHILP